MLKGLHMTQAQTTVAAPAAQTVEAPKPTFVLAPISMEASAEAVKGFVAAAKALQKGEAKLRRNYLLATVAAARLIGVPLTSAQFDRQVLKALKDDLDGKVADVTGAASKAKAVALAVLSGDASLQPVAGETMNAFLDRVRVPLLSATLPDGTPIHPKAADGTVTGKRGAKAGVKKAPASAGDMTKEEGGDNASAKLRAAQILLGDTDAAKLLVSIAQTHRDDFAKWAKAILAEKETAKRIFKAVDNANVQ
jgi:hypothetical protein